MIINAKTSLTKVFLEGVAFGTDVITIESGSTYCQSDRRSDFEGVIYRESQIPKDHRSGKTLSNGKYHVTMGTGKRSTTQKHWHRTLSGIDAQEHRPSSVMKK
jgi:hypothetical protein